MADEPKNASSRRASDAGLEALLQEIEADAKVAPARLPTNRRLEAFVGGFTASTFFATQDDGDAPLEVVPIPLPALRLQLSNLPDSLDFDLFELAQHELPSLLHYVLQDAGVLQRFAVPADALAGFLGVLQRLCAAQLGRATRRAIRRAIRRNSPTRRPPAPGTPTTRTTTSATAAT